MKNGKVYHATGALVAMRSIESSPNPRVPVNKPIPNFPGTPNDVTEMTGTLPSSTSFFSRLAN